MSTQRSHRHQRIPPYLPDINTSLNIAAPAYHSIVQPVSPPLSPRSLSSTSIKDSVESKDRSGDKQTTEKKVRPRRNIGSKPTVEIQPKTGRMGYDTPTQPHRRLPPSLLGPKACGGEALRKDFGLGDLEAAMCLRYMIRDSELMAEGPVEEEVVDTKDDSKAKRKNGIVRTLQKGRCENCGMDEHGAIMWRSDKIFEQDFGLRRRLCNRCGLYKQTNSIDRPILQPWVKIAFRPLPTELTTFYNDNGMTPTVHNPMEETISESEEDNVEMDELPTLESELDGRTTLRQPLAVVSTSQIPSSRPPIYSSVDLKTDSLTALGLARLDDIAEHQSQGHMWNYGIVRGSLENSRTYTIIHEKPQHAPARSRMYGHARANSRSSGPYIAFSGPVSQLACDTAVVDSSGMLITPPYSSHDLSPRLENSNCASNVYAFPSTTYGYPSQFSWMPSS